MTILINLMLVFAIALLVWPRPLKKTLRLFVPAAVSLVSVVIAAVIISWGAFRTVTVTALNDKNAAAEGTEIWIKSVMINGIIPGLLDLYLKFLDLNGSSKLYAFQIYITLNYIGVMFFGRMIYEYAVNTRKTVLYSVFTLCVGFSGVIGVTYVYARLNGNATEKFLFETQLLPVLFGAGVLSLFACFRKRFADLPTAVQRTITRLSGYAIGIYFIHEFNIWTIKHISSGSVDIAVGNSVFQTVIMCASIIY